MFQSLYPIFITGILLATIWWFRKANLNPDSKRLLPNLTFWGSALFYAVSMFMSDFSIWYKILLMLPRDIAMLTVTFLIANNLKSARGYFVTAMTVVVIAFSLFSGWGMRLYTYTMGAEVDSQAELLFESTDSEEMEAIEANLEGYNLKIEKAFPDLKNKDYSDLDNYYVVNIPDEFQYDLNTVANIIYASGGEVGYNNIVKLSPLDKTSKSLTANDIEYDIDDPNLGQLWGFEKMEVNKLYLYLKSEKIKPKKKARIAILDTGVDSNHEDINDRFVSIDNKHNSDKQSHGTHCAGIAASVSNNNTGIASFSPSNDFVEVTSVKVLSDQGWGTDRGIIDGIIEAADNDADVISLSLGGPSSESKRRAFSEAVKYANKSGAIVVVAAGNETQDATKVSPANAEGVITVSAVDESLNIASFSNWITNIEMGIAAPGVNILSTIPGDKYQAYSGTSMATPYVAGLLGLMKSIKPDLETKEAYEILKSTGKQTNNPEKTGNMIFPLAAVKKLNN